MLSTTAAAPRPSASQRPGTSSGSLFPPIPAPLQRLFDSVPLFTYPANEIPDDASGHGQDSGAEDSTPRAGVCAGLPTLHVFIGEADAALGRASFNPTCLKWQTFLRFAGIPVRLRPSTNHASPTGALPFLLPARRNGAYADATTAAIPPRPIPAHELAAFAAAAAAAGNDPKQPVSLKPSDPRTPAYQALVDTSLRRAWLHAVYLVPHGHHGQGTESSSSYCSMADRLYAQTASSSRLVQAALSKQLRAAASQEVYGPMGAAAAADASAMAVVQIYKDAQAALAALSTLLHEEAERDATEDEGEDRHGTGPFFFGSREPTLFDAAVFSYTHLLLEDGNNDGGSLRFGWPDRTLPDMVRALPRLVQHRQCILERYWPEEAEELASLSEASEERGRGRSRGSSGASTAAAPTDPGADVGDSVIWVKV